MPLAGNLAPYDVLLYQRSGALWWLIKHIDGTDVNHVALSLGDDRILVANPQGIAYDSLAGSLAGANYIVVTRLNSAPPTLDPVAQVADRYRGRGARYSFEGVVLCAVLAISRKLTLPAYMRSLIRWLLGTLARELERLLNGGMTALTCSEFAFRCYDEAIPNRDDDPYTIAIDQDTHAVRGSLHGLIAVPRARGRGLHPESLIARVVAWRERQGWRAEEDAAAIVPFEPTPGDLEELVAEYQAALRAVAPGEDGTIDDLAGDPEIRALTDRVAIAWARMAGAELPEGDKALVRPALLAAYATLARVTADLVTPGDLRRSQSLGERWTIPHP